MLVAGRHRLGWLPEASAFVRITFPLTSGGDWRVEVIARDHLRERIGRLFTNLAEEGEVGPDPRTEYWLWYARPQRPEPPERKADQSEHEYQDQLKKYEKRREELRAEYEGRLKDYLTGLYDVVRVVGQGWEGQPYKSWLVTEQELFGPQTAEQPAEETVHEPPSAMGDQSETDKRPPEETVHEPPSAMGDQSETDKRPPEEPVGEPPLAMGDQSETDKRPPEEPVREPPSAMGDQSETDKRPPEEPVREPPLTPAAMPHQDFIEAGIQRPEVPDVRSGEQHPFWKANPPGRLGFHPLPELNAYLRISAAGSNLRFWVVASGAVPDGSTAGPLWQWWWGTPADLEKITEIVREGWHGEANRSWLVDDWRRPPAG
jgi:hypothetical protein